MTKARNAALSHLIRALRVLLVDSGLKLREGKVVDLKLTELRRLYEPYVHALATHFRVWIPPWVEPLPVIHNHLTLSRTRRGVSLFLSPSN